LNRLPVVETPAPEEKKASKWTIFGFVLFFIALAGIIIYVVLQQWYKRKYENYLFGGNRNDLYNMVNYVNNALKKGLSNSQIERNLRKAGWKAEKIKYVMKKYAGRRTGMVEIIPIDKILRRSEERNKFWRRKK